MKKLGLLVKEIAQARIKEELKKTDTFFVLNYSKLSGPDLNGLRQSLKETQSSLFMVKNNVAKRALKNAQLDSLIENIEGPCGLVFTKEDPARISRILSDFSRDREGLKLKAGFLKDRVLTQEEIKVLASLASREVLRAQAVMTLKSPVSGMVLALAQILRKFVHCLEAIKSKKGEKNG